MDPKVLETMARGMTNHSYPGGVSGRLAIMIRQAAQAALQALLEGGYVVVPREPTDEMCEAANRCGALDWSLEPGEGLDGVNWDDAYRAMVGASLND